MLKMLIVEDEKMEREGLSDFLKWADFGISFVDTAVDGIEGYEKAMELHPDIIITDIKMPGMDGIKMSRKLKELFPQLKIIILTGYDDFQMARDAVNFNANAYILKPLEEEELIPVIQKITEECIHEKEKAENDIRINSILQESLEISKNKCISELFEGRADFNDVDRYLPELKLNEASGKQYQVLIIGLKSYNDNPQDYIDIKTRGEKIRQELEVYDREQLLFWIFEKNEMLYKCCMTIEEGSTGSFTSHILNEGENNLLIGLGEVVSQLGHISLSYAQAMRVIEHGKFRNLSGIINYEELELLQKEFIDNSGEFLIKANYFTKQLLHALRTSNDERLFSLLDELFLFIDESLGADKSFIINYLNSILNETLLFFYTLNRDAGQTVEENPLDTQELLKQMELTSIKSTISDFYTRILEMNDKKVGKDIQIVKIVTKLIEERYMQDINLKSISREVFLSPNYLGSIFKKCTGKTFNDFLCEFRMEKAKLFLETPKNKVSTVAQKVGIPNTSYFCTIFKDTFGMAPGEYQEAFLRGK